MTHHEPFTPIDANRSRRIERIYGILSGDDRYERSCAKIPESDCTNLPRNYLLNIVNGSASKLAEQVASAKLAIPWLMGAMGAPALLVGLLLPLRQAGTLLPQLAVSGTIRSFPIRKWFWAGAALVQALMLLVIVAASALPPTVAGVVMVTGLLIFSMARGVGSVAFQDVTGKTIPKGKRGKLLAARGMIGGLLTIAAGILLKAYSGASSGLQPVLILICCGAVLWVVAALAFAAVKEVPGAVGGGRTPLKEAAAGLALLRREVWFRRFLLVRTALLSVELSSPFYVLYAKAQFPSQGGVLGSIIIAAGLSAALSSPIWGRFADLSSRKVLTISGMLGALAGVSALGLGMLPADLRSPLGMAGVFMLLGFAEAGVLLGRKTYLIDRVDDRQRSTYVAFANSAIGIIALSFGGLGIIAQAFGIQWLIAAIAILGVAGGLLSWTLPEISAGQESS